MLLARYIGHKSMKASLKDEISFFAGQNLDTKLTTSYRFLSMP